MDAKNGRNDSRKIKRETREEDNMTERDVRNGRITHQHTHVHTHTHCCFVTRTSEKEDTVGE